MASIGLPMKKGTANLSLYGTPFLTGPINALGGLGAYNVRQEVYPDAGAIDGPALKAAAHKLKGSIATFGAARAVQLARGLELCGVSGDIDSARASGPELQDEVRALCASAQAWLSSQAGGEAPS